MLIDNQESNQNNIAVKVSQAYLELRRVSKKDPLLRFIEKVSQDGSFIWSTKKERLNGSKYPVSEIFYRTFADEEESRQIPLSDINWRLPYLLPRYYQALKNALKEKIRK